MEEQQPELNALGKLFARFVEYGHNASNNLQESFSQLTLKSWIRLTVFVGGYMLLRPYIMKMATKTAVRKMEEEDEKSRKDQAAEAKITPNEFRGIKEKISGLQDDGEGSGADWGGRARMRQRQMLKDLLEEEERRQAAKDDADIQEFLVD
ncbi:hypothetical protein CP532_5993 [Ophiocordyceps camponoti-leonardi (nom. inval.)]|nr:hypothetical protein CP532_5993 [Ophiocordyceps camponoti-leonardi (nom. inval.)]